MLSFVLTCVEAVPWVVTIHAISNPLCCDFFLALIDRTGRVLGKAWVREKIGRVNIAKENLGQKAVYKTC